MSHPNFSYNADHWQLVELAGVKMLRKLFVSDPGPCVVMEILSITTGGLRTNICAVPHELQDDLLVLKEDGYDPVVNPEHVQASMAILREWVDQGLLTRSVNSNGTDIYYWAEGPGYASLPDLSTLLNIDECDLLVETLKSYTPAECFNIAGLGRHIPIEEIQCRMMSDAVVSLVATKATKFAMDCLTLMDAFDSALEGGILEAMQKLSNHAVHAICVGLKPSITLAHTTGDEDEGEATYRVSTWDGSGSVPDFYMEISEEDKARLIEAVKATP